MLKKLELEAYQKRGLVLFLGRFTRKMCIRPSRSTARGLPGPDYWIRHPQISYHRKRPASRQGRSLGTLLSAV